MRTATAQLEVARGRVAAEAPELRAELEGWRSELAGVESEKEQIWKELPPAAQTAYSRQRVQPAVAEVRNNQCTACRVTVTSSGMQVLRKGDEIVRCENCGRILVPA
jgi:predicted  nucleic acid-binding Zn-ribbon protein